MPKVVLTQTQRDESAIRKWETRFRATVLYRMTLMSIRVPDLAKRLAVPRSTMYERLRKPHQMTITDLLHLMDVLKFSIDERGDLFGFAFDRLKSASSE